jgi:serine/threonine-protein kinase
VTLDRDRLVRALPSYEIGQEIGRGAWGVVLAARHRQLDRSVAIKELPAAFAADPGVRRRFNIEAKLLASLDHPHIVPIYDYVEDEGLCLLVMEMLSGGTVWSRFTSEGVSAATACGIVIAACGALHHAHASGVLHRDVKPENLLFSSTDTLKVSDFGIAKVVGGAESMGTRTGEVLGTPAYMAPEQALGTELSPATDVYALGTVLYELLSGRLPFADDGNPIGLLYRHVHEAPTPLGELRPDLPPPLVEVTMRSLARDPADRFSTAEEFGVEIADAASSGWGGGWVRAGGVNVMATGRIGERLSTPPTGSDRPVSAPPGHLTRSSRALATVADPAGVVPDAPVDLDAASPNDLVPLNEIVTAETEEAPPRAPATVAGPAAPAAPAAPVAPSAPVAPLSSAAASATQRSRLGWIGAAIGVAVLVAIVTTVVLTRGDDPGTTAATDPSVAPTTTITPSVTATIFAGQGIDHMASGAAGVWITNRATQAIGSIDPATNTFTTDVRLASAPHAIAEADGVLWVTTQASQLLRIDVRDRPNPEITTIDLDGPLSELAVGEGAAWGSLAQTGELVRVDLDRAQIVTSIPVGSSPDAVAVGGGSVWVANRLTGVNGTVTRIDPSTNQVAATIDVGVEPDSISFGAGSLWVANSGDGTVSRIDPSSDTVVATMPLGGFPHWVTADGPSVWVTDRQAGTVSRIDTATNTVAAVVRVGLDPESSVVLGDSLWVANLGDGTVSRVKVRA